MNIAPERCRSIARFPSATITAPSMQRLYTWFCSPEVLDWLDDPQLYADLLPAAQAAMDWVDRYGDLDGDGLTEFERRSPRGLLNQGWKDSGDANAFRRWNACESSNRVDRSARVRLCSKTSHGGLGRAARRSCQQSVRLENEAKALRERIDRAFWMPDRHYYAMALDRDKRQLASSIIESRDNFYSPAQFRRSARKMWPRPACAKD